MKDREKDGNTLKGEKNKGAKLTEKEVKHIIELLKTETTVDIQKRYPQVSLYSIRRIKQNRSWRHLSR